MSVDCMSLLNTFHVDQGLSGKPGADGPQGHVGLYVSEIPSCQFKYCCLDTELNVLKHARLYNLIVQLVGNVFINCSFLILRLRECQCHLLHTSI